MHTIDYYGLYEFGKLKIKNFFLRVYEELTEYFMIESYVSFLEKATDAISILIKVHFGGLRAPYLQDLLTSNNNELLVA